MSTLRPVLVFAVSLLLALIVVACGREAVTPISPGEQVLTTCSEECALRGQCGTLPDGRLAILASEAGPVVAGHNRFFMDETLVSVVDQQQRELIAARNGVPLTTETTPFPHLFYRVDGEGKIAWVSEWCVARP